MGGCKDYLIIREEGSDQMAGILDGEQHVIAAAYHLVKAIEATKNISDDMKTVLANLDIHLSTMIRLNEGEAEDTREIETRLMPAKQTIMSLHSNHSKIWDSNPLIVSEYLQAVSEVLRLSEDLGNMPLKRRSRGKELFDQTQSILQMAMDRLQNELIHILVQNKECLCEENLISEDSFVSNEDDSLGNASQRESSSIEAEEYVVDLIHPDVVPQIKTIATIMIDSGYDQEFCQVFTAFWRDTLAEYLALLRVQKFSIEDVLQMEWKFLNYKIRKWRLAIKKVIQVYLASAKRLFDHVLGEYGCISASCLVEASKGPLMSLLNFGQAVSIGPHKPEWLFCLLNMYEVLEALSPEVDALFPEGIGSSIKIEFHQLSTRLKDSAKAICRELGNNIALCSSTTPFPNGGIHPLTKYVMNYILCFAEYGDNLNFLLQDEENSDVGPNLSCAMATHLQLWTSILEANLEKRSDLYKDCSLKHIFMMNNIHYMVEKIRNSKIMPYFGDEWIKNHIAKFRQHAMCYERVTWSSILELLHDHRKAGKATLKARSRAFTAAFEDVYKNQTRWCVPDLELREDLRISASKTVIQAYRNFVSKITNCVGEKHVKYTEHDLETYILDLLEGSSKSLNHTRKR
ncbi:Exocyst component protein [Handroanthus impetiginosus]|uniref:Exocyst subunit Exo70 family protein n=1 Tax=Handroanthus impetiginosus TaxID=429701 RepID=A0A2G9G1J6_9LAMI|nr:Exocyst component protein [Handroanthus impetiginosus]